ncbi:MAG: HD-GYP domain-containing protein [Eubacteriales bacterium]
MRLVPINSVKEGSVLAKTIYNTNGIPLLREGYPLNAKLIDKAIYNGIYSLYIHDQYSDGIIEDIISPELRQKAIHTLKGSYDDLQKDSYYLRSNKYNKNTHNDPISNVSLLAKEFVDDILSNKEIIINLVDIKTMDDYTYQHCVNAAILAIVLGVEIGYNKKQLESIAIGALLHDFGKVFIPKNILLKPGKLTSGEMNEIKNHPMLGYNYLKNHSSINPIALSIIMEHHEKVNGGGYPKGLHHHKISKYAKMAAVCDVYDALTSDRTYRKAMSPNEALELIMGSCGVDFDLDIVKAFMNRIVPYPVGTLVELSNGTTAVIKCLNSEYVLRPVVNVINKQKNDVTFNEVDLMIETNIVIKGVHYEDL